MTKDSADVIYTNKKGKKLTRQDLEELTLTPNSGDWEVSQQALQLHQEGRQLGAAGQYGKAIAKLQEAAEEAPEWPYPVYDQAFTYLLMKDFPKALQTYKKVDLMAPEGFFTTKTAIDALSKERLGELPAGIYLLYMQIEWSQNQEEKVHLIDLMLGKAPEFAALWKEKALTVEDENKRLEYLEKGLKCDPDPETRGVLLANKAIILYKRGRHDEATALMGELVMDKKNEPTSARAFARLILQQHC